MKGITVATNQPRPMLSTEFITWVLGLPVPRKPLLWCDECHHWHREPADCPYSPKAGA